MLPVTLAVIFVLLVQVPQDVAKEGDEVKASLSRLVEPTLLAKKDCLRISDGESWLGFWKEHSAGKDSAPPVDFAKDMVLVLPLELRGGQAVVLRSLMIRQTDEALRVILTVTTTWLGAVKPGDPPGNRICVTWAVVPRSRKKVEYYLQRGKSGPEAPSLIQTLP